MATADPDSPHPAPDANTTPEVCLADAPDEVPQPQRASPPASGARHEILSAARKLASCSPDGSFTVMQILTELRRTGTRYTESTIRTHVTSRMCADSPDHHGTTYDDLERMDRARYRLRRN